MIQRCYLRIRQGKVDGNGSFLNFSFPAFKPLYKELTHNCIANETFTEIMHLDLFGMNFAIFISHGVLTIKKAGLQVMDVNI